MLERINKLITLTLAGPHTGAVSGLFSFCCANSFVHRRLIIPVYLLAAKRAAV